MLKIQEQTRTIIYGGEIIESLVLEFTDAFPELDITLGTIHLICTGSIGGDFDSAVLGMSDLIRSSTNNIVTYGLELQASCQGLLLLCGDERYLSPNGYILLHDGTIGFEGDIKEIQKLEPIVARQRTADYKFLATKSTNQQNSQVIGKKIYNQTGIYFQKKYWNWV